MISQFHPTPRKGLPPRDRGLASPWNWGLLDLRGREAVLSP